MAEKLKPCPFCGEPPTMFRMGFWKWTADYWVCGNKHTRPMPAASWNKRQPRDEGEL